MYRKEYRTKELHCTPNEKNSLSKNLVNFLTRFFDLVCSKFNCFSPGVNTHIQESQ